MKFGIFVAVAVAITSYILCAVSLHTLTAISVDVLLALLYVGTEIETNCNCEASLLFFDILHF